ncbi:hypothetical protein NSS79_23380 [Paenibacillus sp. FSL L8-0436]|uniref:hypothetical protein n=1 Tax=Paenibacillus sp. FSL L8-0436 TaxID=2954686 RepID=UPI0031580505
MLKRVYTKLLTDPKNTNLAISAWNNYFEKLDPLFFNTLDVSFIRILILQCKHIDHLGLEPNNFIKLSLLKEYIVAHALNEIKEIEDSNEYSRNIDESFRPYLIHSLKETLLSILNFLEPNL